MRNRSRWRCCRWGAVLLLVAVVQPPVVAQEASIADTYVQVGRPECRADDRPETGLQGQVLWADRVSGRASEGYSCNLARVGGANNTLESSADPRTLGWANADSYGDCYYYGTGSGDRHTTRVIDVTHPTNPVETAVLDTGAMRSPWESIHVHAGRGLLVADRDELTTALAGGTSHVLDVYDVSSDCRNPVLLASVEMPNATGHEGWFSPDGNTYWMSGASAQTVWAIDLTDPTAPREVGGWAVAGAHGGTISEDGMRGYLCTGGSVTVYDTSDIQNRAPDPQLEVISVIDLPDTSACQGTWPVTYDGQPYLLQHGELPGGTACPTGGLDTRMANFSRPHIIDLTDETQPVVVTTLMNEVAEPANCATVAGDRPQPTTSSDAAAVYQAFSYGTHFCHPDRLHDPTILACAEFFSGVRVYDIRDPAQPREIAYYNTGAPPVGSQPPGTGDMAASRPIVRPDRGEIWYSTLLGGFHVVKFAEGVYPFPESRVCAEVYDPYFAHYDLEAGCQPPATGEPVIERVAGPDRIATAAALSQRAFADADAVVVARADDYADALAGAPLAAALRAPILLTARDGLAAATAAEVARLGATRAVLLGGEGAIGAAVADALRDRGLAVERVAGATRFATAAAIAGRLGDVDAVVLAEGVADDPGRGWPDAVSAAPYAAFTGRPVLLTTRDALPADTRAAIAEADPDEVIVVGGPAAVSDAVVAEIAAGGRAVRRLAGDDRYGTSAAVRAEGVAAGTDPSTVWLATGRNWPDALAASAAIAAAGGTFLLVDGEDVTGSPATAAVLTDFASDIRSVNLLGGTAAISARAAQQVAAAVAADRQDASGGDDADGASSSGAPSGETRAAAPVTPALAQQARRDAAAAQAAGGWLCLLAADTGAQPT